MERMSWLEESRVQAPSRPEPKFPGVQSFRVQVSSCPESKSPESKNPESKRSDRTSRVELFWYGFLNLNAIYFNGFCNNDF